MRIEVQPAGWQHSITGDKIRAIITYPLLRYGITTAYPDADTYMFVGCVENEPWIEVGPDDVDGTAWAVFQAMVLTHRTRGLRDIQWRHRPL